MAVQKSTIKEIRKRFDDDVEQVSNPAGAFLHPVP
jgi:hypothetical protein